MKKNVKILIIVLVAIVLLLLLYFFIPLIKLVYTEEGRIILNQKIKDYGVFAPLIYIFLEILQIVAAFIPGAPIEVLGGVLFGKFWGIIYASVGVFAGTVIVFYLVRIFGKPFINKVFPSKKIENYRIFQNEKKLSTLIFFLFLIPGTPKDFLTYLAALTDINPSKFLIITSVARVPSMSISVIMGSSFFDGNYKLSLSLFGVVVVLSVIGYLVKTKLIKNN